MRALTLLMLLLALPAWAADDPPMRLGSKAQASEQLRPPSGEGQPLRLPAAQLSQDAPAAVGNNDRQTPAGEVDELRRPLGPGRFPRLQPQHLAMAEAAWAYFEAQYQPQTGLVNSVLGYRETTLWDVASVIAGTLAARELGLIGEPQFLERIDTLLATLANQLLYDDKLPSRRYHTDSGLPVTDDHNRDRNGSGWSALDIARTLGWLAILKARRPDLAGQVDKVVDRWALSQLVSRGEITGARYRDGGERRYQEGRLGYEQYAAAALGLWGLDPSGAWNFNQRRQGRLEDSPLWVDQRDRPFLTSDPFYLWWLELGPASGPLQSHSLQVFEAHARHFRDTGQVRCFGEDAVDRPPWFLYNNLLYLEMPWLATDHLGRPAGFSQVLSTKCALAWGALSRTPLATELWQRGAAMMRPAGWLAGRYDDGSLNTSLNLNTNGVVLSVLLYIHNGNRPLLEPNSPPSVAGLDQ